MANDLSNPVQAKQVSGDGFFEHGAASDSLFGNVQLAQANTGAQGQPQTIHVTPPQGAAGPVVIRVEVTPGSIVELPQPFEADAALMAKEGDGNLAIRVGDVTIVLQGYVEANSEQPVVVEGADNQPIDIATVLASTDPAIDIQTAAGPDAGQNGQGADNTGAILAQLDEGSGLGGFEGAGTQDGTELAYRTIDNSIRNDFADPLAASSAVFGFSTAGFNGAFSEGFLRDPAQTNPFDNSQGTFFNTFLQEYRDAVENPGQAMFAGWADFHGTAVTQDNDFDTYLSQTSKTATINVSFTNGTGDLVLTGIADGVTSNGSHLSVEIRDGGHTMFVRRDEATALDNGNALVAVIHVDGPDANGNFTVETILINRLDHHEAGNDTMDMGIQFTVYDGPAPQQQEEGSDIPQGPTSPSIDGSLTASFSDDVPILEKVTYFNQHDGAIAAREGVGAGGSDIGRADEDWLSNGAHDQGVSGDNSGKNGDTGGGVCVTGQIQVNFGADGAANSDGATEKVNQPDKHAFTLDTATYLLGKVFPYGTDGLTSGGKTLVVLSVDGDHVTVGIADQKQQQMLALEEGDTSGDEPTGPTDPIPGTTIFTLTLDQVTGAFKFELKGPLDHGDSIFGGDTGVSALADGDPENTIPLQFGVTATDDDGDTVHADINIDVNDDMPVARDDLDHVVKGSHEEICGNVMTGWNTDNGKSGADTQGADHAQVVAVKVGDVTVVAGKEIQGLYGKLVIEADGRYTYTRDAYTPGGKDDVFEYTLKDGDGDESKASLTIHINNAGVCVEVPTGSSVSESGLPDGSSNPNSDAEFTSGTITIKAGDGIKSLTIGSETLSLADLKDLAAHNKEIPDAQGKLTLTGFNESTGELTYKYELEHNTDANTVNAAKFDIKVTDSDDQEGTATLEINIVDDAPTADNDQGKTENQLTATGNVMTNDVPGADGATVTKLEGVSTDSDNSDGLKVNGQYGTLEMQADGTYTYTRNDDKPTDAKDVFTYTLTDSDGDVTTATLTIGILDRGVSVALPTAAADTTVSEAGLPVRNGEPAGSDAAANSEHTGGTITITAEDGVKTLEIGGHTLSLADLQDLSTATPHVIEDSTGKLTLTGFDAATGALTYTYDLKDNTNANTKTSADFDIKVTDSDGDTGTAKLVINIVDDQPTANCDSITATAGRSADVQFIVDISGSMKGTFYSVPTLGNVNYPDTGIGLERYAMAKMLTDHPEIQNVQIVLFSDHASKTVWLSVADALTFIQNGNNFTDNNATNYDEALTKAMDGIDDARPLPKSDQTLVYFFSDGNPNEPDHGAGIDDNGSGNNVSQAEWQQFVDKNDITNVFTVGIGNVTSGELAELTPISYPNTDVASPSGVEDNFFNLTSSGGVTTLMAQTINGLVSAPSAAITGNVTTNDVPGADGYGNGKLVSVTYAGTEHDFSASIHQITLALGTGRGTLVINDDGSFTYKPPVGNADGKAFSIDYTIQDGDGDQSTAQLKIDLKAAPEVDLDANCEGHNATASFVEDGGAVHIAPAGIISDDGMIGSMVVTLTNRPDGNATEGLTVGSLPAGLTSTYVNGVLTITGTASAADYQAVLRSIVYQNTSQNPNETDRTVTVVVRDTESTPLSSITHVVNISVEAINDAPTATALQSGLNVDEQVSLNIAGKGLSVADIDAGSETITVKLTVDDAGLLTVSKGSANVNVSGSGSDTVTITGSQSEINKVLTGATGSMTFKDDTDAPQSSVTLKMTVNDNGHNGDGGSLSASVQTSITINAINDKPVTDLNGGSYGSDSSATFTEDSPAVKIAPNGTISDVDSASLAKMTVTITNLKDGSAESLSINPALLPSGVTASYSNGVLTITGSTTVANYQTILQNIVYNNSSDTPNTTARNVTVVVNDGALNSDSHSSTVSVVPHNDAPTAQIFPASYAANEDQTINLSGKIGNQVNMLIGDPDSASDDVYVTLSVTQGKLDVNVGTTGVSIWSGDNTSSVTIKGSVSEINNLLKESNNGYVKYVNDSNNPAAHVTLTLTVNDDQQNGTGQEETASATTTIDITPVNDKPVTDLNGGSYGSDSSASFNEDSPAVKIAPNGTISDVDSSNLTSMTVTITNLKDGAAESLSINPALLPAGVIATYLNGVLTISGSASVSAYQGFLQNIVYNNTSDTPNTTNRTVTVVVSDGSLTSDSHTSTVSVAPHNDAPTATALQSGLSVDEQVSLNIAGKGLSVNDVDAGSDTIKVTLTVDDCGLLTATKGGANVTIYNSGSGTVTIYGSQSEINKVLSGATGSLSFKDDTDTPAATVKLTMTVDDQGNNGNGVDETATVSTTITINPINEAPVAVADHIYTNAGNTAITVYEWMLLRNDTDADTNSSNFDLVSVINVSGSQLTHFNVEPEYGTIGFTDTDSKLSTDSKFDYGMTDGMGGTATGHVTVHQDTDGGTLRGSAYDDIVIAGKDKASTIDGGAGDDIIIGSDKGDKIDGGDGDDYIFGGRGNDSFIFSTETASGNDKYDGGGGFDRVIVTGNGQHVTWSTDHFSEIDTLDLGDGASRDRTTNADENKFSLDAHDLVGNAAAGYIGDKYISLWVIGDQNGNGNSSTGKDNVDLANFTATNVTANVTDTTGISHNFTVYTGVNQWHQTVNVAVETGLAVTTH